MEPKYNKETIFTSKIFHNRACKTCKGKGRYMTNKDIFLTIITFGIYGFIRKCFICKTCNGEGW